MIGFLLKKWFFDLWDNLFKLALINVGFIAAAALPIFLPGPVTDSPELSQLLTALGVIVCCIYLAAAALSLRTVSDYSTFGFLEFRQSIKRALPVGICLGLFVLLLWVLATFIIPFYLNMNSLTGLFLAAVVFWTLVVGILSFQFFLAVRSRLDTRLLHIVKKSFVFFFDNPGLCVLSLFFCLLLTMLSVCAALLIPGPAGILLFLDEAMRLRILKYDWLEANPNSQNAKLRRRKIPWDTILAEERERTGTRSFKSFIFPWKY
ncbi:hypothetical protein FACS1894200_07110 [Spirochaetia bacterium]|nr:hypothetical protein FACS1894200_07110 [Spirochaetia bacterium]